MLPVHNNLVRATDRGHVSLLMLLNLKSAFDNGDQPPDTSAGPCPSREFSAKLLTGFVRTSVTGGSHFTIPTFFDELAELVALVVL